MRLLFILCCLVILVTAACSKIRFLASEPQNTVMPPVQFTGVAQVPGDEPPVVRTDKGFTATTLPGLPPAPPTKHEYIEYRGPSN